MLITDPGIPARKRSGWDQPVWRMAFAAAFVLVGLKAAGVFHGHLAAAGAGWPQNTFLFKQEIRFTDLKMTVDQANSSDPYYQDLAANYFPFVYWAFSFFRSMAYQPFLQLYFSLGLSLFAVSAVIGSGLAAWRRSQVWRGAVLVLAIGGTGLVVNAFWLAGGNGLAPWLTVLATTAIEAAAVFAVVLRGGLRQSVVLTLLTAAVLLANYPLVFGLDRGNVEVLLGALCLLSMVLLVRGYPWAAALILAPAIAVKGYPIALCLLFAVRKETKAGLGAASIALVLTLASFALLPGGFIHNYEGLKGCLARFHQGFNAGHLQAYCADPLSGMRLYRAHAEFGAGIIDWSVRHYYTLSLSAFALCALFALGARAPFHRKLLAMTLGMLMFPDVILDYKLIHLVTALVFMVYAQDAWEWRDILLFFGMLVLLIPKHYYYVHGDTSISCLLSPLVLVAMFWLLLLDRRAWLPVPQLSLAAV